MKNRSPLSKVFLNLALIFMSLIFSACGSAQSVASDAVAELEQIANGRGEIEMTLDIQLKQLKGAAQSPGSGAEWRLFTGITPKGKTLEGIIVLERSGNALGNFEIQDLKVRGKVTKVKGQRVFSGFYSKGNNAAGVLLAYNPGETFDAPKAKTLAGRFAANAEFLTHGASTFMVARGKHGVVLGILSEDLGFSTSPGKETVELELRAELDGFIGQGTATLALPGFTPLNALVVGIFVHISV